MNMRRFFTILTLVCMSALLAAGCARGPDRCFVDDNRYAEVKKLYEKTQTLDMVRLHLEDQHDWRKCEINEVIYRLKKEYHLEEAE